MKAGTWGDSPLLGPIWGRFGPQRGSGGLCGAGQAVWLGMVGGKRRAAPSE